jgi:hypothetical protein
LRFLELRQPIALQRNPFQFDLARPLHLALPLLLRRKRWGVGLMGVVGKEGLGTAPKSCR